MLVLFFSPAQIILFLAIYQDNNRPCTTLLHQLIIFHLFVLVVSIQVSQPGDFHLRREDSIFSISDRLTEVLAKETLTDDLDRKWFLNTRGPCCLWPPPCLLLVISVAQIILYLYNSVAEHPLVLHPIKFHEPWRYITYFLGKYMTCSLIRSQRFMLDFME